MFPRPYWWGFFLFIPDMFKSHCAKFHLYPNFAWGFRHFSFSIRLKGAWLISWVITSYVLRKISEIPAVRSTQFFQNSKKKVPIDIEIKFVLVTFFFTEILSIRSCQMLIVKMTELGQKTESKMCYMHEYLKIYSMLIKDILS